MRESEVESHLNSRVEYVGGFTRKWTSPGHAGVEDRICFFPDGELWFIEVKAPGNKPSPAQWREIMKQRALGHNAGYLSSTDEVDRFVFAKYHQYWMTNHIEANYVGD